MSVAGLTQASAEFVSVNDGFSDDIADNDDNDDEHLISIKINRKGSTH